MAQPTIEFEGKQYARPDNKKSMYLSEAFARIGGDVKWTKTQFGMIDVTRNSVGPHCPEAEEYLCSFHYGEQRWMTLIKMMIPREELIPVLQRLGKPLDDIASVTLTDEEREILDENKLAQALAKDIVSSC